MKNDTVSIPHRFELSQFRNMIFIKREYTSWFDRVWTPCVAFRQPEQKIHSFALVVF